MRSSSPSYLYLILVCPGRSLLEYCLDSALRSPSPFPLPPLAGSNVGLAAVVILDGSVVHQHTIWSLQTRELALHNPMTLTNIARYTNFNLSFNPDITSSFSLKIFRVAHNLITIKFTNTTSKTIKVSKERHQRQRFIFGENVINNDKKHTN